jgi:hypothetical protein
MLRNTSQEMKHFYLTTFQKWHVILNVVLIGNTRIEAYTATTFHLLQFYIISDFGSTAGIQ